jgi:hypothetical protein
LLDALAQISVVVVKFVATPLLLLRRLLDAAGEVAPTFQQPRDTVVAGQMG